MSKNHLSNFLLIINQIEVCSRKINKHFFFFSITKDHTNIYTRKDRWIERYENHIRRTTLLGLIHVIYVSSESKQVFYFFLSFHLLLNSLQNREINIFYAIKRMKTHGKKCRYFCLFFFLHQVFINTLTYVVVLRRESSTRSVRSVWISRPCSE